MAITILDYLPDHLKNFLIGRGIKPPVDPNAVPVSSGLVPSFPRRRVVPENAHTSGDMDVDPPANIPFDSSYFSNLLGGLFGGSKNTPSIATQRLSSKTRELEDALENRDIRNKLIEVMGRSEAKTKTDNKTKWYWPFEEEVDSKWDYELGKKLRSDQNPVVHSRFDEEVPLFPDAYALDQHIYEGGSVGGKRDLSPLLESKNQSSVKNFIAKTQKGLLGGPELDRSGRTPVDRFFKGGLDYLSNPYLTGGEKAGFTLSKLAPSFLGTGGSLIGLFGAIGQAMGGYHPLDQASDIFMDPFTGISRWESPEAGGGGVQTGILNLDNQIENLAKTDPGRYLTTPYGYITAGEFDKAIKSGALHFGADLGGGQSGFEDMGFRQDKPFMLQDVGNSGDTWQRGIQDLEAGRGGAIWNQAGAIVDQINERGGSAGYNDIQAIAEGLAMGAKTGVGGPVASDMANIYGFDYGDLGIDEVSDDTAYADSFSDTTMDSFGGYG